MLGFGAVVRVHNRVRDLEGKPVPYEGTIGGDVVVVETTLDLPWDLARILVHQSMYKIDPVSSQPTYRLGVQEFGLPLDPLPLAEVQRDELYERELDPSGRKVERRVIHNPIRRMDAMSVSKPGMNQDGAHPAVFSENP